MSWVLTGRSMRTFPCRDLCFCRGIRGAEDRRRSAPPRTAGRGQGLEHGATPGLLPPGVLALPGEADHQVVPPLVVQDVLLDILHSLTDRDPLDVRLPPQLLHRRALLLNIPRHPTLPAVPLL